MDSVKFDTVNVFDSLAELYNAVSEFSDECQVVFAELDEPIEKAGSSHPRDDWGRLISLSEIQMAVSDPVKADELRAKVTNPTERRKLDSALVSLADSVLPPDDQEFWPAVSDIFEKSMQKCDRDITKSMTESRAQPGWDEHKVVRDDIGRFADKATQHAATQNPAEAKKLLARVTKPAEREKLISNLRSMGMKDDAIKAAASGQSSQTKAESPKQEQPKAEQPKPVEQPKPAEQAKPAEQPKPAPLPKPPIVGQAPSSGAPQAVKASPTLAESIKANVGFTYNPIAGKSPTTGFAVAMQGTEKVLDLEDATADAILDFVLDNHKALMDTSVNIGAWHNKADGKVYLDLSKVYNDRDTAVSEAKNAGQLGIYDLAGGQTIETMTPEERADFESKQAKEKYQSPIANEPVAPTPPHTDLLTPNIVADHNGDGITDASRVGVMAYHVPSRIPRLLNLTKDERAVESAFADWYEKDPDAAARKYRDAIESGALGDGPTIYNTDDAKNMSMDYANDLTNRSLYNLSVHQTANAIAKRAFLSKLDDIVKDKPEGKRNVLITAGGVACGKGYALGKIPAVSGLAASADAVWDSAGDQYSTELPWIHDELQKRGITGHYVFVNADPMVTYHNESGAGVVSRGVKSGRVVDHIVHAESYTIGASNFDRFHAVASGADNAQFYVIDNPRGAAPKLLDRVPLESIPDAHTIAMNSANLVREAVVPDWVKRGALQGQRVWKGFGDGI